MNNGEAILSSITVEMIADGIREKYNLQLKCKDCPVYNYCDEIYDKLEQINGIAPSCHNVISHWLKSYKDYVFYSHTQTNKHKVYSDKDYQYYFRNRCNSIILNDLMRLSAKDTFKITALVRRFFYKEDLEDTQEK